MTADITVSVHDITVVRKSLDLPALFAASTRTVRQINCVENRTMVSVALAVPAYSQEEKRGVRRVLVLNAKLSRQKSGHIHTIGAIMPRFVVASNNCKYLVCDRLKQIHHRGQFFHWREVYISIPQT